MKINKELVKYFETNSKTDFISNFYGISVTKEDFRDLYEYSSVVLKRKSGLSVSEISKSMNISRRKIEHWIYDDNKPFIIRLLEHYLSLKDPGKGFQWLSINSTRGGLFTGTWI